MLSNAAFQAVDDTPPTPQAPQIPVFIAADGQEPARQLPLGLASLMYLLYLFPAGEAPKKLRAPLKVEIETTELGRIAVYAPAVRLSGIGGDIRDAIVDLSESILGLSSVFGSKPFEALAESAQEELRALRFFGVE